MVERVTIVVVKPLKAFIYALKACVVYKERRQDVRYAMAALKADVSMLMKVTISIPQT